MADILEKTVELLDKADFFIVPVKRIWDVIVKEFPDKEITISQFTEKLKKDERFRIFAGTDLNLKENMNRLVSEKEMEKLGFYKGPRVMLKDRIPSRKEVVTFLLKKADQTFEALKKAWEIRPEGDEETEDQLLGALAKAQRLQRELRTVLGQEETREMR